MPISPKLGNRSLLDLPSYPEPFVYHHKIASIVGSQGLHIGLKGQLRGNVLHMGKLLLVKNALSRKIGEA